MNALTTTSIGHSFGIIFMSILIQSQKIEITLNDKN